MRIRLLVVTVLLASSARATPNFPDAIKAHLSLGASPPCTLCHTGGVTQRGTVTTPFGTSMRARGLVAYDEHALTAALDTMARDQMDSDGDGIIDVDELAHGTDPNTPDNPDGGTVSAPRDLPIAPEYGCGVAEPRAPSSPVTLVAVTLVAMIGVRSRRRWSTVRGSS